MTAARIEPVNDDDARRELRDFLAAHVGHVHDAAVPMTGGDGTFATVALAVRDDDGRIIAGVLGCRPDVTVTALTWTDVAPNVPVPGYLQPFVNDPDSVMTVDLIAVAPHARRTGLGRALLAAVEQGLAERGARFVFASAEDQATATETSDFFRAAGYTVVAASALPEFRGRAWVLAEGRDVAFHAWKKLAA